MTTARPIPGRTGPGPVCLASPARRVLSGRQSALTTTLLHRAHTQLAAVDDAIRYCRQLTHDRACHPPRGPARRPRPSRSAPGVIPGPGSGPAWVWHLSGAFRCRPAPVRPVRRGPPRSASSARPPSPARRAPRASDPAKCDDRSAAGRSETGLPLRYYALEPGFHYVQLVRSRRTVMLMVSA